VTLPNDSQRHVVIGRTGSGKTQLATHLLSLREWHRMPWVILNFKDDQLLNDIPGIRELDGLMLPPVKKMRSGLYMARPDIDDFEGTENLMTEIWRRTHTGMYIDEALPLSAPRHPALRRILTQGRSRRIPVIAGSQRPVDIDRYFFSEAEFLSVMDLTDDREADRLRDMVGVQLDMSQLPRFHSYYFDRLNKRLTIVTPVPDQDAIIGTFERRLRQRISAGQEILI
jgi:hypothetical protein